MKIHPQIIVKNQIPEFVVLPYQEYEGMLNALEDQADIQEVKDFRNQKQNMYPFELVQRMADGEHPITVFRQSKKMTQRSLAKAIGVSPQYINTLEKGKARGHVDTLKKIATVLDIDLEVLT